MKRPNTILKIQFETHLNQYEELCQFYKSKVKSEPDFNIFFQHYLEYNFAKYKNAFLSTIKGMDEKEQLREFPIERIFPKRKWEFSFLNDFFSKHLRISQVNNQSASSIYYIMKLILQGKFYEDNPFLDVRQIKCSHPFAMNQKFFQVGLKPQILNEYWNFYTSIVISVGPHIRIQETGPTQIIQPIDMIRFLSIQQPNESPIIQEILRKQLDFDDPFLEDLDIMQQSQISMLDQQGKKKKGRNTQNKIKQVILPRIYEEKIFKGQKYLFHEKSQKWIRRELIQNLIRKNEYLNFQKSMNHQIQKYLFTPNYMQYQKFLKNMPSLKIKPKQNQFMALAQAGDSIVIGRSGTGKTTISLIKLFLTDAIFNLKQNLDLARENQSDEQISLQNKQGVQIKTLYLTASPLLAQQIKQKYHHLVNGVENDLKQKNNMKKGISQILEQTNQEDANTNQILFQKSENEDDSSSDCEIINFDEEEENQDQEEIDEYEQEMGYFKKFSDIQTFPAFLTIRKLLFLIDSNLQFPFFKNKSVIDRQAQWHNESIGVFSLNQQDQINKKSSDETKYILQQDQNDEILINTQLKEVNLDIFQNILWPKLIQTEYNSSLKKVIVELNPTLVWSEIMTKIKGHESAYLNYQKYLSQEEYFKLNSYQKLTDNNQSINYQIFENYEILKKKLGYYDLLDLVNHINFQLKYNHDILDQVHYIVLDELQDLPKAFLVLLSQLSTNGLFLSGDNAQNIVKGVSFKFNEIQACLQHLHKENKINKEVKLFQLDYNFRSTQQILILGNLVIKMLQILYPEHLDNLPFEKSSQQGKKPIFVKNTNISNLLQCLSIFDQSKQQHNILFNPNTVIIVRDQDSKMKVPSELQNILILTIYEAKGLEFDDVILFNFFSDSLCSVSDWEQLAELDVQTKVQPKNEKKNNVFTFHQINKHEIETKQIIYKGSQSKLFKASQTIQISQELKLLYVAITRPRKKLVVFDDQLQKRMVFQRILQKLDIIEINDEQIITEQKNLFNLDFIVDNKGNWRRQGFKLFSKSIFEQADKCFRFAEDDYMAKKSMAYHLATKAALNEEFKVFLEAANIFQEIGLLKRAAQCYFSAKKYAIAYDLYLHIGSIKEAAESAYFAGYYSKAGQLFKELKDFEVAIDCFDQNQDWQEILNLIEQNKHEFTLEDRELFLNKYLPRIFDQLVEELEKNEFQVQDQFNDDESQSFSVQNSQFQVQNAQSENSESFFVCEQSSFDHLSVFDPENEWLKNDKNNIINSLNQSSQIPQKFIFEETIKQYSYIHVSEKTLNFIIEKLKQFSNFKRNVKQDTQQTANDYLKDDISKELIDSLLQQLEKQGNFKLCIIMCNSFELIDKLGDYIILLISNYCSLVNHSNNNNIYQNSFKRRQLKEQGILCQIVLQNILKLIKPDYQSFKYENKITFKNSLGITFIKQLISLGFWKTALKQTNFEYAIELCQSFNNYQVLVEIFQAQKEKDAQNILIQTQFEKYHYFLQISEILYGKRESIILSHHFSITNKLLKTKQLDFLNLKLNFQQSNSQLIEIKLKYIESIILSFYIINGNLEVNDLNQELIIELMQIYLFCINQLSVLTPNQNIIECLQFIYKFSFPKGELLRDYNLYIITTCDSLVLQLSNEIHFSIDIDFEHFIIPVESLQNLKKNQLELNFINKIQQDINNFEVPLNFTSMLKSQFNYQIQQIFTSISNKKIQNHYYKINYYIQNKNEEYDDQQLQIINLIKYQNFQDLHQFLLKSNHAFSNDLKQLKYYIIRESLQLFKAAKQSIEQSQHGFIILAINLLNYCNSLPIAIFTIQQYSNKQQNQIYLKYIEFLVCQNQMIVEDMFDCYFEYFQITQDIICHDEWLYHLIRLGMILVITNKQINQFIFPEQYLKFISQKRILDYTQSPFQIEHDEIIQQYFENLSCFLSVTRYLQYLDCIYLLIIVYIINTPLIKVKLINQIISVFTESNEIHLLIIKQMKLPLQNRLNQFLRNDEIIFQQQSYKICIIQTSNDIIQITDQAEKQYQASLNYWNNLLIEAKLYWNSGQIIIRFLLRMKKTFQLKKTDLSKIQKLTYQVTNNQFINYQDSDLSYQILKQIALQKELIQELHKSKGNEFHIIFKQLEKLQKVNSIEEIQKIKTFLDDNKKSKNIQNQQNQVFLTKQRLILKERWQKLKAGVKIRSQNENNKIALN